MMLPITSYEHDLLYPSGGTYYQIKVRIVAPEKPHATVFLLHDFLGNSKDLINLGQFLASQGYKSVMPDMPGRGKSAWLPENSYTYRTYLDVFASVFDKHHIGYDSVLGVNWGAAIALLAENTVTTAFAKTIFVNLAKFWSLEKGTQIRDWKKICSLLEPSERAFLSSSRDILGDEQFEKYKSWLSLKLCRGEPGFSLGVDPALFTLIEKSPRGVGVTARMLSKVRSRSLLINQLGSYQGFDTSDIEKLKANIPISLVSLRTSSLLDPSHASVALPLLGFLALN